jgi:pheromone shutdown protein TraB
MKTYSEEELQQAIEKALVKEREINKIDRLVEETLRRESYHAGTFIDLIKKIGYKRVNDEIMKLIDKETPAEETKEEEVLPFD